MTCETDLLGIRVYVEDDVLLLQVYVSEHDTWETHAKGDAAIADLRALLAFAETHNPSRASEKE